MAGNSAEKVSFTSSLNKAWEKYAQYVQGLQNPTHGATTAGFQACATPVIDGSQTLGTDSAKCGATKEYVA